MDTITTIQESDITTTFGTQHIAKVMAELSAREGHTPITAKAASDAIKLFKEALLEVVGSGRKVTLPGFLSLDLRYVPERTAMNLVSRMPITVNERIAVGIRLGKHFKTLSPQLTDNGEIFELCKSKWLTDQQKAEEKANG